MSRAIRTALVGGLVATGCLFVSDEANAQWGYYGPAYGGRSFSFGFSTGPSYSSYYAPGYHYSSYGYTPTYVPSYGTSYYSGYAPTYSGYAPTYSYVPTYTRPRRGRLSYDVYTPFGRSEVNYRFRRDGRVRVDIDD